MDKLQEQHSGETASITERLWAICADPATEKDRYRASLHVLDWLGCALAGLATPTGQALALGAGASPHPFSILGVNGAAAMGGLGSIFEMDDVHRTALLHPGPVVLPAVLAAAPESATDFLEAIICGYEAMIRLGSAVGPAHYAFFHNTSTCGSLGSAAGAARALNLNAEQAVHAMGHAMSTAGGLWQCRNEPSATKHLHLAEAARRGVQAALWAREGLVSPRKILEGPQGFFAAVARDGKPGTVLDRKAQKSIHEVSFKPWPACRHAHPTIDAALVLRERLQGRAINSIVVRSFRDAILFCDKPHPKTPHDAKFSLQHCVAVVLLSGKPQIIDFDFARIADSAVEDIRMRVTVLADDRFTQAYPVHFGSEVGVTTSTGEILLETVADAWGDSEKPLSEVDLLNKFFALADHAGVANAQAKALADAVRALPCEKSTRQLRAVLNSLVHKSH